MCGNLHLHSKQQDFGSNAAALGCALRARSAVLGRKWSEEVESASSATGPATPACTPHKDAASVSGAVSQTLITFLSAAKPADEGTLSVVVLVVGGAGRFLITQVQFSEVCSKVARFFNIISKPKYHFAEVCSKVARFYKPTS